MTGRRVACAIVSPACVCVCVRVCVRVFFVLARFRREPCAPLYSYMLASSTTDSIIHALFSFLLVFSFTLQCASSRSVVQARRCWVCGTGLCRGEGGALRETGAQQCALHSAVLPSRRPSVPGRSSGAEGRSGEELGAASDADVVHKTTTVCSGTTGGHKRCKTPCPLPPCGSWMCVSVRMQLRLCSCVCVHAGRQRMQLNLLCACVCVCVLGVCRCALLFATLCVFSPLSRFVMACRSSCSSASWVSRPSPSPFCVCVCVLPRGVRHRRVHLVRARRIYHLRVARSRRAVVLVVSPLPLPSGAVLQCPPSPHLALCLRSRPVRG